MAVLVIRNRKNALMVLLACALALLLLVLAVIATTDLGFAGPLQTHINDVCAEHEHNGNTIDCTNQIGWDSDHTYWWGIGRTATTDDVDRIWVRISGVQMCYNTPEWQYHESLAREDSWFVSVNDSADLADDCYPLATISNFSWHTASGVDDSHSGSMDRRHPNAYG